MTILKYGNFSCGIFKICYFHSAYLLGVRDSFSETVSTNTNLVLSDSGATLKFKFCTLKNTTHTNFQLKISTPGILAAIRSSGKSLWNYSTGVNGFQKFLCVVDGHEKTNFLSKQIFLVPAIFWSIRSEKRSKNSRSQKSCYNQKFVFSCPSTTERNFWNPFTPVL